MTFKTALEKLKSSDVFVDWDKENPKGYLSYGFTVLEKDVQSEWQIGFYNPKHDKVTTFTFKDGKAIMSPEEEVFKKPDAKVLELKADSVKITIERALDISSKLQEEKYSGQEPIKSIIILQNIQDVGPVWNITHITKAFNTLNVKIDALSGEIKEHKLSSLMDLRDKSYK